MTDTLRIGIVCYPSVGGSSIVATEAALYAAEQGHEVHLISYDRPYRLRGSVPGLRYHNVAVSGYPLLKFPPYDLALATRMLEVREEANVELFHVHYAIPHAVSAFLARAMSRERLRFVTTLHGTDITVVGADRAYMRPTRFAIEQSDGVTAVSQFLASETALLFGIRRDIRVIPNFVDIDRFQPGRGKRYYERDDDERIIVHASNFRPIKRVADVVRTFAAIARELPAKLLLVGDGPDRDHALAVAADLGCLDRIHHLGNQESMEALLDDADLYLSASESESFGLTLLEAMSSGVPCATTDVGGVREVLGPHGLYAPFGDPEALARAGLSCLRDADRHRELAVAGRQRAVSNFERSQILNRYFDLYREVLNQP